MSVSSPVVSLGRGQEQRASATIPAVQPKRHPIVVQIVLLVFVCLTMLLAGLITVTRTPAIRLTIGPPAAYLPGHALPPSLVRDADCVPHRGGYGDCRIQVLGEDVYLTYELKTRRVMHTALRVHQVTVGDLILAWGTPTGLTRSFDTIHLFWGKRSAAASSAAFQAGSQVTYIIDDFEQQPAWGWGGFRDWDGFRSR